MISEKNLTEEFFRVFGIEPEYTYIGHYPLTDENGIIQPPAYPEITAEKLLEIICILSQSYPLNYEGWSFFSVQELKEMILGDCVDAAKKLSLSSVFANKIQKLFKEDTECQR